MALKLDIRPFETVYINGAEICNGDRKISLVIMNKSRILRESEMVRADEARSALGKFTATLQEFVLKENPEDERPKLSRLTAEILEASPGFAPKILEIQKLLSEGKPHAAFKIGKTLMTLETVTR